MSLPNHEELFLSRGAFDAARAGDAQALRPLLDRHPLLVRRADEFGSSLLAIACEKGHVECAELLIDRGADLEGFDAAGCAPAMICCANARLECLKLLARRGANLSAVDEDGWSLGAHACSFSQHPRERADCLRFLASQGVDLSSPFGAHGEAPASPAARASANGQLQCLIALAEAGADLGARRRDQPPASRRLACRLRRVFASLGLQARVECSGASRARARLSPLRLDLARAWEHPLAFEEAPCERSPLAPPWPRRRPPRSR